GSGGGKATRPRVVPGARVPEAAPCDAEAPCRGPWGAERGSWRRERRVARAKRPLLGRLYLPAAYMPARSLGRADRVARGWQSAGSAIRSGRGSGRGADLGRVPALDPVAAPRERDGAV